MAARHLRASVHYNDFIGTVAADERDLLSLRDDLKELEIPESYSVYAFDFSFPERHKDVAYLNVLAVKDLDGYDSIIEKAQANNNVIDVEQFSVKLDPQTFFKLFKQFQLVLHRNFNKYSSTTDDYKFNITNSDEEDFFDNEL